MEFNLVLFVVLIGFSGFFSSVEIAYFSLSAGRVRAMVRRKLRGSRRVEQLKAMPERLLVTILIGNNIVNISAAAIATKIAIDMFGSTGVGIASGAVTLIVLVFGEIMPKSFGQTHAGTIARLTAPILSLVIFILTPVSALFELLIRLMHKVFPGAGEKSTLVSEEEIRSMMHIGVEEGSVEHHERRFVERLFRFNDMPVSAVMVQQEKVIMLDGVLPVKHAVHPSANSGYSRFPVYEENEANIIGLVHIKDIVRAEATGEEERPLKEISRAFNRIPQTMPLDDVLRKMQKERQHIYFVEDKRGNFAGIVTMEDIIEELLGEIYDESDSKKIS